MQGMTYEDALLLDASVLLPHKRLLFTNFEGKEQTYTKSGNASFCVPITEEEEEILATYGVKIRACPSAGVFIHVKIPSDFYTNCRDISHWDDYGPPCVDVEIGLHSYYVELSNGRVRSGATPFLRLIRATID